MTNITVPFFERRNNALSKKSNELFKHALDTMKGPTDVLSLLGRYAHFNAPFGAGVAHLASVIAVQYNLFRDDSMPKFIADCSHTVAEKIYFASIDEFYDRSAKGHPNHRTIAQATIKGLMDFYSVSRGHRIFSKIENDMAAIRKEVLAGYGFQTLMNENDIFRSIGFHIASELLADKEFNILYDSLREHHPELVKYLTRSNATVNGKEFPAYMWIKVHTTVEAEHRDAAVDAAILALKYYTGKQTKESMKKKILEGFDSFKALQFKFMKML